MIYYPEDENPNAATEEATTHESNAVVNNEGGTSETPSNLVGFNFKPGEVVTQEELNRILSYNKDSQLESKLTPNPAGFGFTRQEFVDSLPPRMNARPNTLYCLKVKNDNILVGYKLFKFVLTPEGGEFRPFGATPDLDIEDGGQATPRNEVNEPRTAFEKVFNGNVGFNGDIFYKGKLLHIDEIDDKGFDILTLTGESGTLSDEDYNLAASNQCAILVAPVYLYKDRNASTLLLYKSLPFVSDGKTYYLEVEITKADKSYVLSQVELSGQTKLYRHNIKLVNSNDRGSIFLNIILSNNELINSVTKLKDMLINNDFIDMRQPLTNIAGRWQQTPGTTNYYPQGIYCTLQYVLGLLLINPDTGELEGRAYSYAPAVTDTVTDL